MLGKYFRKVFKMCIFFLIIIQLHMHIVYTFQIHIYRPYCLKWHHNCCQCTIGAATGLWATFIIEMWRAASTQSPQQPRMLCGTKTSSRNSLLTLAVCFACMRCGRAQRGATRRGAWQLADKLGPVSRVSQAAVEWLWAQENQFIGPEQISLYLRQTQDLSSLDWSSVGWFAYVLVLWNLGTSYVCSCDKGPHNCLI